MYYQKIKMAIRDTVFTLVPISQHRATFDLTIIIMSKVTIANNNIHRLFNWFNVHAHF